MCIRDSLNAVGSNLGETLGNIIAKAYQVLVDTPVSYTHLLSGKTAIIAKPVDASCGEGVQKFTQEDFADSEAFYEKLKADASAQLLEDVYKRQVIGRSLAMWWQNVATTEL